MKFNQGLPDISIIIPTLNERDKIARDIRDASDFLATWNLSGEIIVVDDGSADGTAEAARISVPSSIHLEVISYRPNRGKGYAVRRGILASRGRIVLFIDSGNCVSFSDVARGVDLIQKKDCDIAHASRFLKESRIVRPQRLSRRISAILFRMFIRRRVHIPAFLTDTQCGLKIYDGEVARSLYRSCDTDRFMFDIEIILIAIRSGYRIREFPIRWTADPDSRLSLCRTFFLMMSELIRIRKWFHGDRFRV